MSAKNASHTSTHHSTVCLRNNWNRKKAKKQGPSTRAGTGWVNYLTMVKTDPKHVQTCRAKPKTNGRNGSTPIMVYNTTMLPNLPNTTKKIASDTERARYIKLQACMYRLYIIYSILYTYYAITSGMYCGQIWLRTKSASDTVFTK